MAKLDAKKIEAAYEKTVSEVKQTISTLIGMPTDKVEIVNFRFHNNGLIVKCKMWTGTFVYKIQLTNLGVAQNDEKHSFAVKE